MESMTEKTQDDFTAAPASTALAPREVDLTPIDLFDFEGVDPAIVWKNLDKTEKSTAATRVEIVGTLAIEELSRGKKGYVERIAAKLQDDKAISTLQQAAKVFRLFRTPKPYGLGWSRDKLESHALPRLKPFAQSADWALANPERVEEMLAGDEPESELRFQIAEAKRAALKGPDEPEVEFENIVVRVEKQQAKNIRDTLEAMVTKAVADGKEFSTQASLRHGKALHLLCAEWIQFDEYGPDDTIVPNSSWLPGAELGSLTDQQIAEAVDAETQAAIDEEIGEPEFATEAD